MAETVVYVDSAQSHLEETLSRSECVHAGDSGIRFSLLGHIQSSETTRRTRSAGREKYSGFVLEIQRVCEKNGETGELENKTSVLLRYYRVFNIEQCDG